MNFSEYVYIVSMLCMMGTHDLIKFMFACADSDGSSIIGRQEFEMMNEVMAAGTPKGDFVNLVIHFFFFLHHTLVCIYLYPPC